MKSASHKHPPSVHQACIDACVACHLTCTETLVRHCVPHGGALVQPEHVRLMLDCAEICHTNASFLMRDSLLHHATCRACAEVCSACANSCRGLEDAKMQECAVTCAHCADACARMAEF